MPKKRTPREVWIHNIRPIVWNRDKQRCVRCNILLRLEECHVDHIVSGKLGSNKLSNLRTLCRRCHVLRSDHRHRGMIAKALTDGIIPPNWRELVWDEEELLNSKQFFLSNKSDRLVAEEIGQWGPVW